MNLGAIRGWPPFAMGARQSSEAPAEDAFVDYYELLEVEQTDSADVIRKSYRRLALRLHPDKNPGREEEANKKFIKLQEAYDVLSDDQERAWYDQNRERLMQGLDEDEDEDDVDAKFQFFKSGGTAPKATSMASGIGVPHILRFYAPSMAKDLRDTDTSFYGTYRRLFERMAEEDRVAAPYPGEDHTGDLGDAWRDQASMYPSFGHPDTPYTDTPAASTSVRDFYQFWMQFSSRKSFAWKDKHDLRDAPDRRVKRLMEKENKRAREQARREYNDAIRGLAAFIRRRDPRYKAFQAQQQAAHSAEAQAELAEKRRVEAAKRQDAKRQQAASFQAQSWQMAGEPDDGGFDDFSSGASLDEASEAEDPAGDDDDEEETMWDCVACNKRFQSEAAWINHERSKKHKKEVQRLKREMLEDDEMLDALGEDPVAEIASETQELHLDDETSRKKDKKRKKQEKKMRVAMGLETSEPMTTASPLSDTERAQRIAKTLPHLATLPSFLDRPEGSFDVFGYGSLIFKPPPHVIGYTPGYIKGFVRRFAQSSVDHRGTPERPGRVVTLVSSEHWHSLPDADEAPEGDIVWGISYTIDPAYADEVRAYLDHREKNGYTPIWEPIYGFREGKDDDDKPHVLVPQALVYVGLPGNEAFIGPTPLDALAERIASCHGPSGPNYEYLLRLAEAVRTLTPHSEDFHLFTLEEKVLALQAKNETTTPEPLPSSSSPPPPPPDTSKKARRKTKGKTKAPPGSEVCNVCHAAFPSRSKLFNHVREQGHALASSHMPKK